MAGNVNDILESLATRINFVLDCRADRESREVWMQLTKMALEQLDAALDDEPANDQAFSRMTAVLAGYIVMRPTSGRAD